MQVREGNVDWTTVASGTANGSATGYTNYNITDRNVSRIRISGNNDDAYDQGNVVIGQIHADEDEPLLQLQI